MSVTDYLLRECEVLDWWNTERLHVDEACRSALERYVDKACVAVDELSSYQLLYKSEARLHIQRKLQSDINVFNRRMELKLRKSCELSMARNTRPDQFASFELRETAALMASGAAAVWDLARLPAPGRRSGYSGRAPSEFREGRQNVLQDT